MLAACSTADISEAADTAGLDPTAALLALADEGLVAVNRHGRLVAAYPFSPTAASQRRGA